MSSLVGRPLRLVLVTETFPPEINGVARTLGRWAETFRRRGHVVRVVRPRQPGEPAAADRVYGMPLPCYPQVRVGVASPATLARILRSERPDLVHIATEGPLGLAALVACRTLTIPVASSFHTNFDAYAAHYGFPGGERLAFAYLRWFHNRTRVTLVPSQATRWQLLGRGVRDVEIWSRGVDSDLFHPRRRDEALRRSIRLAAADLLVLYVGRLAPEKNLDALLLAYTRLRHSLPAGLGERTRLVLIGSGPLTTSLLADVPPGVLLAGVQRGTSLARWYASADLFAFPSLSETFGNVVLEAQASGLPVVGFDCQGVNEQVTPEVNGLLVPVGGDLAAALERLCLDPELRRRYGAAGRARAAQLDWEPIFDDLEACYRRLIASPARTRHGPSPVVPTMADNAPNQRPQAG